MRPPVGTGTAAGMTAPSAPVTYITKRFPRLSETFILDEIIGLERSGVALRLYSIADPGEITVQPDVARVVSPVTYLVNAGAAGKVSDAVRSAAAHLALSLHPRRLLDTLRLAWRYPDRRVARRHVRHAAVLARAVRRDGSTHIHAAFAHSPASIARLCSALTGVPFSFAGHAKDIYRSDPTVLAERATRAAFVLTCSESAANALRERAPDSRIIMLHHGVDTGRFAPREDGSPGSSRLQILAVGRLVAKKGYPVLLDALARLERKGVDFRCTIIGDGDLRSDLQLRLIHLGLGERVEMLGARTHQEIADSYRQADVFVQSSVVLPDGDRDGIPNALLEAMASGLAVVASRVAGIPEVVTDRRTGLLVDPGQPAQLADALLRLREPATRRALGEAARAHVADNLDRRVCAARVADLFERSVATSQVPEAALL